MIRNLYVNGHVALRIGHTVLECSMCPGPSRRRILGQATPAELATYEQAHLHDLIKLGGGTHFHIGGPLLVTVDKRFGTISLLCPVCTWKRPVPGALVDQVVKVALAFSAEHQCRNGATG